MRVHFEFLILANGWNFFCNEHSLTYLVLDDCMIFLQLKVVFLSSILTHNLTHSF